MNRVGQIWDTRSGKSIVFLKGHVDDILTMDFSNHSHLATGSSDNTTRIWDLRNLGRSSVHCLLGHTNLVSMVKYRDILGETFCCTGSYDGSVRIYETHGYTCLKILEGSGDKVVGLDWSPNGSFIGVAGYERIVRVYGTDT